MFQTNLLMSDNLDAIFISDYYHLTGSMFGISSKIFYAMRNRQGVLLEDNLREILLPIIKKFGYIP